MEIKAIIFDWARTLYDVENEKEFDDAEPLIAHNTISLPRQKQRCTIKEYR